MKEHRPSIPFNRPSIQGNELAYVQRAVEGGHTASSGQFSKAASRLLRESLTTQEVLLTTSCTDALEMTALLLDIQPGDTVVVPSFTFVSTALAYARAGAGILFCDIESRTLGLDPNHLATLMDDSVRAVVPVHYAGIGCDLAGIREVTSSYPKSCIIEDNAHGLFGRYRGQPLGSFGRMATLSFHETKNFICGEGGALVLNREEDVERARILYDKGTNRHAFLTKHVDKYSWQDVGSSFGLSDVLAAYLCGQLEERTKILQQRRALYERYIRLLEPYAGGLGFLLPRIPSDREQAYHMFYVLLPDQRTRDVTLDHMKRRGVQATFHYVPLHSSPGGRKFRVRTTPCPVTDSVSGRLLRLPFYNTLSHQEADRVAEVFLEAVGQGA